VSVTRRLQAINDSLGLLGRAIHRDCGDDRVHYQIGVRRDTGVAPESLLTQGALTRPARGFAYPLNSQVPRSPGPIMQRELPMISTCASAIGLVSVNSRRCSPASSRVVR